MSINAPTEKEKRSLEHFPIQLFAIIMGMTGLSIVYAKAYHLLGFPYLIYEILLGITTVLFLGIFTIYMMKWLVVPEAVKKEYLHPIKSSFMATIAISFLLLSIAYYDYAPTVSIFFWYIGAPLQLFFMLSIVRFWIHNDLQLVHSNPAWFIPIVGNVLVPIIGIEAAPMFVSLFYFAIGIFFWLVLFTIMIYRIVFHHPMAKKLLPTLFIFIAPPAVAFVSYFRITQGSLDMFAIFLYCVALATFFLLLFMIKMFDTKEFFISWWAYTFPLAAMSIATLMLHMALDTFWTYCGSLILITITSLVVGFVVLKTLQASKQEQICISEEA
ncbi:MAG: SLAC1 anion channel family protein [Campylobacterota bacterium]|nr:SLAC1 anion channel family protein [Campylobacterota bacterium]